MIGGQMISWRWVHEGGVCEMRKKGCLADQAGMHPRFPVDTQESCSETIQIAHLATQFRDDSCSEIREKGSSSRSE